MLTKISAKLVKWIEWLLRLFEIILSLFMIVGVIVGGVMLVFNLQSLAATATNRAFQNFLDNALLYIIGLEVALMLIKRDPHLVTDILIFAIARKMIVTMQSGIDFFLGALAILLLYLVKSYGISRTWSPKQLLTDIKHGMVLPESPLEESQQTTRAQSEQNTEQSTNS